MNALLTVHDTLDASPFLRSYLTRHYESAIGRIDLEMRLGEQNKELIFTLHHLSEMARNLLIVTTPRTLAVIGKILATLSESDMQTRNDLLMPASAEMYDTHGYLMRLGDCHIQVVRYETEGELPPVHLKDSRAVLSLNLFGMAPEDADILLTGAAKRHRVRLSSHPHIGGWSVMEVSATQESDIRGFLEETALLFAGKVWAGDSIARHLVERLNELGRTFTCAESCTGGRIASLITDISGSSAVFDGSMITYANRVKHDWIGVNETSLIAYGAVSSAVVEEMAAGILDYSGADYAVAVSGIAGPGGGSVEKPVGTVYIACASRKKGVKSERLMLRGDRGHIQASASFHALRLLLETFPELI